MKSFTTAVVLTALLVSSCEKDKAPRYQAEANFTVGASLGTFGPTDAVKVATHDELSFSNWSKFADSVRWDFGNGETSSSYNISYAYPNPGNFTATLTVYNKTGTKSSHSRQIRVLERVIKKVTLFKVYLNNFEPFYQHKHIFANADLWVEVKYDRDRTWPDPNANGTFDLPIIYKSPVFNIDSSFHGTITYDLPQTTKVVIDYPVWAGMITTFPEKSRGTILELWGRDQSGTYLMGTSWAVGLHVLSGGGNPNRADNFDLGFSVPDGVLANQVKLECAYK